MTDNNLSQIITGIKDCLMSGFGPHLSKIPATADGCTLAEYLEALAQHFVPAIERLLAAGSAAATIARPVADDPFYQALAQHRIEIEGLRAELAAMKGQIATAGGEQGETSAQPGVDYAGRDRQQRQAINEEMTKHQGANLRFWKRKG